MKIRPSARQTALYKIFSELKLAPQSRFKETDLIRAWNHTGLRYADLKMVLHDLILRGLLQLQTVGAMTTLQLIDSSPRESNHSTVDFFTRSLNWLALRRVRNRSRSRSRAANARSNRRLSDRC